MRCIALIIAATATAAAWGGPGFFSSTALEIPPAVREASGSVYKVMVDTGGAAVRLRPADLPRFRAAVAHCDRSVLASGELDSILLTRPLILEELRGHSDESDFNVPVAITGTGFSLDGNSVLVALHVFRDFHLMPREFFGARSEAELTRSLAGWHPRVLLADAAGEILFDSKKNDQTYEIGFSGHPVEAARRGMDVKGLESQSAFALTDVIQLRLRGLRRPLRRLIAAPARELRGERVFAPGYPLQTHNRQSRYGVPDADGLSLAVAQGVVLPRTPPEYAALLRRKIPDEQVRAYFERGLIFTDVDVAPGMSGAPILNERGEVLGITTKFRGKVPDRHAIDEYNLSTSFGPSLARLAPLFRLP